MFIKGREKETILIYGICRNGQAYTIPAKCRDEQFMDLLLSYKIGITFS